MEFLTLLFGTLCRQRRIKFNHCITGNREEFFVKLNILREQAAVTINDEEVRNLINRSIDRMKVILSYAHEYDYSNVPSNGFRSIILIVYHSIKYGIDNWSDTDDNLTSEFRAFLTSHLDNYDLVENMRSLTQGKNDSLIRDENFVESVITTYFTADHKTLEPLYSRFAGLVHGPDSAIRFCTKLFHTYLIVKNPSSLLPFKFLSQSDFYVPKLDRIIRSLTMAQLPKFDHRIISTVVKNTYTLFAPSAYIGEFTLASSEVCNEYVIKVDYKRSTVKMGYELDRKPTKIRCLIIRKSNKLTGNEPFEGNVLLYLHGGAWSAGAPEFQLAFLPRWTHSMPGLTVLCPQQLKSPEERFPSHLQSYLDLYMWLVKAPKRELVRHLGLSRISSIIVAGDSSGGLNVLNLLYILSDIKNGFNCLPDVAPMSTLLMPYSVHLYYPAISLNRIISPSYLISPHHWVLNPSLIRSVLFAYIQHKVDLSSCGDIAPPDYRHQDTIEAFKLMNNFITYHPYCDPLVYANFSSLKSTPLHILTVPSDVWIDHIVTLLKKWPGECSLNTVEDLPHAFLVFPFLGKQFDQVVDALAEKLKMDFLRALTLHKPDIFLDFNYN